MSAKGNYAPFTIWYLSAIALLSPLLRSNPLRVISSLVTELSCYPTRHLDYLQARDI
jgi:hypothetical protein